MSEFQSVLLSVVLEKMKEAGSHLSADGWTGDINIPGRMDRRYQHLQRG